MTSDKSSAYTSTHPPDYVSVDVLRRLNRNEPFVGREEEMRSLLAALEGVAKGSGRIVTLSGEPGIGKTRCAEELSVTALERDMIVIWGHCHESFSTPAYWPWVEAIESRIKSLDPEDLKRLFGRHAAVLADLLPSIREKIEDIAIPQPITEPEAAQFRLFDSLSECMQALSVDSPVLIVLEDLNWADAQTLEFLEFFATRVGETALLILGTYRDVELSRKHPLSTTLGALVRSGAYERVVLRRLSDDAMQTYLDGSLRSAMALETKREVIERTEGNPFFLQETIRQLNDDPNTRSVAEGIREALGRRLDRLSEAANELLAVAAIIGRDFSLDILTWIDDELDASRGIELLNEAVRLGLIEETANMFGGYRFSHALIQETLLEEIPLTRRVQLHGSVAKALEAHYGDNAEERAAELLHHFTNAQLLIGCDDIVRYAQIAGDRALSVHAYMEAARCFKIGLDCLADAPMDDLKAALSFGMGKACTAGAVAVHNRYRSGERGLIDAFDYYRQAGQRKKAIQVCASGHMSSRNGEDAIRMIEAGSYLWSRALSKRHASCVFTVTVLRISAETPIPHLDR